MQLCGGNVTEYNELMNADVATYLLKFEVKIKEQQHGKGHHSI